MSLPSAEAILPAPAWVITQLLVLPHLQHLFSTSFSPLPEAELPVTPIGNNLIPFPASRRDGLTQRRHGPALGSRPLSALSFLVGRVRKRGEDEGGKTLKEPGFKGLPGAYGKGSKPKEGFSRARTESEVNSTKHVDVWNIGVLSTKISAFFPFKLNYSWFTQCVTFWCVAKWFRDIYIYIPFLILFCYRLLQGIEYSSLCYMR